MGSINWDASVQSVMQLAIQFPAESYSGELVDIRLKEARGEKLSQNSGIRNPLTAARESLDIYDFAGAGASLQGLGVTGT